MELKLKLINQTSCRRPFLIKNIDKSICTKFNDFHDEQKKILLTLNYFCKKKIHPYNFDKSVVQESILMIH